MQALMRGAQATASAAFEQAAELSVDSGRRGHRLVFAAQSSLDAGRPDAALALVERARSFVEDPRDSVALNMVLATNSGRRGSPVDAYAILRDAGLTVAEVDPDAGSEMLMWSLLAAMQGGWSARTVPEILPELERIGATGDVAAIRPGVPAGCVGARGRGRGSGPRPVCDGAGGRLALPRGPGSGPQGLCVRPDG